MTKHRERLRSCPPEDEKDDNTMEKQTGKEGQIKSLEDNPRLKKFLRSLEMDNDLKIKVSDVPKVLMHLNSLEESMDYAVTPEAYSLQALAGIKEAEEVMITLKMLLESILNGDYTYLTEIPQLGDYCEMTRVPEYKNEEIDLPF